MQVLNGFTSIYLHRSVSCMIEKGSIGMTTCLFSYRASQNDTTGFSPFFMESGRHPRLPAQALFETVTKGGSDETSGTEWSEEIVRQLRRSFELARERQIEVARKNKDRDTRGRTPT